jgi:hypothetical protein
MVNEAESHAEEHRKRHVSVELRNEADNLPYEKLLGEHTYKITDAVACQP